MKRLILWDIDGTLIRTSGTGRKALEVAAAEIAQLADVPHVDMSGKTDPQILRDIFTAADIAAEHIETMLPDAMSAAEKALAAAEDELRAGGYVIPGIRETLERLHATDGVRQALLTGNLTPNAALKVGAFGLTEFFDIEVGAYGTDHADRLELVPIALERVARLRGEHYAGDEVWVIGDTPNDLACARAGGVKCLIVGDLSREASDAADAAYDELTDVDAVCQLLTS